MEDFDVVIIGAGAAGMICAIEAGRRGRRVLLLDHAKKLGEKIRISGGGRCNFTNLNIEPECFISKNPRFAVSALARFTQWDFVDRLQNHAIAYHEKTLGQLFCDNKATDILEMLLAELQDAGVDIWTATTVKNIAKSDRYTLQTTRGTVTCSALVVATGGKSIPKIGATGFGYQIAEQFGLPMVETRPALVPLTFGEKDLARIKPLAGVSVDASVTCRGTRFDESLLFTHRGLSGPSILQISSYWREGDSISVNLLRGADVFRVLKEARHKRGRQAVQTVLAEVLPKKLAQQVTADLAITGTLADQSDKSVTRIAARVHDWRLQPTGSEGYRTAEVTLGGVDTDALDARSLCARAVPGLYFIGEVVDVTGWLGGYNFQWAWSSGWAAGQVV